MDPKDPWVIKLPRLAMVHLQFETVRAIELGGHDPTLKIQ